MWSMPRSVLRIVAVILALCAAGGFVMGLRGAPQPARLPGEGAAPTLEASDARPVDDLVLTPSELEPDPPKVELPEKAEEEAPQMISPPPPVAVPAPAPPPKTPAAPSEEDRVGDLIDGLTPPPEQPPY